MPNFGFIIDNRRCIGCHACTVACKSEHSVPVGVNRTWVKYIEKGEFPNSQRNFSVMRCNHCDNSPCTTICPVSALYRREDGIVDFDNRRCIGCKACMQACPYDALYIDPQTHTAAKCNYCAHRIDVGLEPACVNVCPTQAIISGDLDDPNSKIATLKREQEVTARLEEKKTVPSLFYIDGAKESLDPLATPVNDQFMWSGQTEGVGHFAEHHPEHALDRLGRLLSLGEDSKMLDPVQSKQADKAQEMVSAMAQEPRRAYDAPQKGVLWGWQVSGYLWTKAISAGAVIVLFLAQLFSLAEVTPAIERTAALISLIFLGLTGGLLVWDLDKPSRFVYTILRPQWSSWLAKGAYVITAFSVLLIAYSLFPVGLAKAIAGYGLLIFAIMTAIYTAFLFRQAKARDWWQAPTLPLHMLIHSVVAGAAFLGLFANVFSEDWAVFLTKLLVVASLCNLLVTGIDFMGTHHSSEAKLVAESILNGRYKNLFWNIGLSFGILVPLILLIAFPLFVLPVSCAMLLIGIFVSQHILVRAPQQLPLS